ncbi:Smg-4/UPF3 family-domain-containing protein [Aspergillus karnatakaensis]|uniref:putative nonsense-mediated mRNA decay protein Upf3 n=1 Tax=Aspergillus karnatakaensis TaxID=1810916 RepID=UPI003CCD1D2B
MTQILSRSTAGVLPVPASATQKNASSSSRKAPKPPAPRLKLLVRRLPPGLTQEEFETALGAEWKSGAGKIGWNEYKPGKVSKDPAKPSRPSRAYLQVTSSDHIGPLSDKVRSTSFIDARNTVNDPILLGPPNLEFAPFAKVPGGRSRKDARQGTIDQDPEFIQFLESLTQPITKAVPAESAEGEDKKEVVTTTPLVQYIKDKKANKAKEAANKSAKHRSEKDAKSEKIQSKKLLQRPDKEAAPAADAGKPEKRSRADKATKEAVKAANKQAISLASKQGPKAPAAQNSPKDTAQPAPERKRERGNAAAAARILQRDLGLAPPSNRRRGGRGAAADGDARGDQAATETSKKETQTKSPRGGPTQDAKSKQPSTPQSSETPASQRSETSTPVQSTSTPRAPKAARGKQPSTTTPTIPTATQAFLKHANPSQGVTEPLLDAAFAPFGKVIKVEIDKKKGFGYVDFAEPESLQKAIAASPVTVAQSQVVVLERKANPGADKGRGKGRAGGGGGGGGGGEPKPPNPSAEAPSNRGGKPSEGGSGGTSSGRSRRSARGHKGGGKGAGAGGGGGGGGNANSSENKAAETK